MTMHCRIRVAVVYMYYTMYSVHCTPLCTESIKHNRIVKVSEESANNNIFFVNLSTNRTIKTKTATNCKKVLMSSHPYPRRTEKCNC